MVVFLRSCSSSTRSWRRGLSCGMDFSGPCTQHRAGGRVHRDTAPIIRCMRWLSWINMVVIHTGPHHNHHNHHHNPPQQPTNTTTTTTHHNPQHTKHNTQHTTPTQHTTLVDILAQRIAPYSALWTLLLFSPKRMGRRSGYSLIVVGCTIRDYTSQHARNIGVCLGQGLSGANDTSRQPTSMLVTSQSP